MWDMIVGLFIRVIYMVISHSEKRKLSDKEFIEYVRKHQERLSNSGQSALDVESSLDRLRDKARKRAENGTDETPK